MVVCAFWLTGRNKIPVDLLVDWQPEHLRCRHQGLFAVLYYKQSHFKIYPVCKIGAGHHGNHLIFQFSCCIMPTEKKGADYIVFHLNKYVVSCEEISQGNNVYSIGQRFTFFSLRTSRLEARTGRRQPKTATFTRCTSTSTRSSPTSTKSSPTSSLPLSVMQYQVHKNFWYLMYLVCTNHFRSNTVTERGKDCTLIISHTFTPDATHRACSSVRFLKQERERSHNSKWV